MIFFYHRFPRSHAKNEHLETLLSSIRLVVCMPMQTAKPWAEHLPTVKQPAELVRAMTWLHMKTLYAQPIVSVTFS